MQERRCFVTAFEDNLNQLLVKVYRSIEQLEEVMLHNTLSMNLSIGEMHMLEAVAEAGRDGTATISKIAEFLDIRLPSVTAAVNKLVAKGLAEKAKSPDDGRVILVTLTRQGKRAEHAHRYFHRSMVRSVTKELSPEDQQALLRGISKLDDFLDRNISKYKEPSA